MKKNIIRAAATLLVAALFAGCGIYTYATASQATLLRRFLETNFEIDLSEWNGEQLDIYDYGEDIHEVYDDTAVVKAYKTGDTSALTDEKDKYILAAATNVIDALITPDMSDYDKELAVYNWIYHHTRFDEGSLEAIPDEEDYSYMPYGVLKNCTAICVGNATTFKLFMDMLDIECLIIHSVEEGEHAWNMVKIGGEWYHLDLSFDGGEDLPAYACFNVTDEVKDGTYPWDREKYPAATATEYCFLLKNRTVLDDLYAMPEAIKSAADEGKSVIYISFTTGSENFYEAFDLIYPYLPDKSLTYSESFIGEETIFTVYISDPFDEEDPDDVFEPLDYDRMTAELDSVFGFSEAVG